MFALLFLFYSHSSIRILLHELEAAYYWTRAGEVRRKDKGKKGKGKNEEKQTRGGVGQSLNETNIAGVKAGEADKGSKARPDGLRRRQGD